MSGALQDADLSWADMAIIEDTGEQVLKQVGWQTDADHILRLTESQAEAVLNSTAP